MFDPSIKTIGDYVIDCFIGCGNQADVYMGHHKLIDCPLAIKIFSKNEMNAELKTTIEKEIDILKDLDHPNIVKYIDYVEQGESTAIITEYCSVGTFSSFFPLKSECQVFKYFRQISEALDYLHNVKKIVHRDIKAENILLDEFYNLKLIDFGFAKSNDKNIKLKTRCGSPVYTSPEIIKGQEYNEKSDIWSLGILLYYMATGAVPFFADNVMKLYYLICDSEVTFPNDIPLSESLKDLIYGMLSKNIDERHCITEVMHHPWFVEMKNEMDCIELKSRRNIDKTCPFFKNQASTEKDDNCVNMPYLKIKPSVNGQYNRPGIPNHVKDEKPQTDNWFNLTKADFIDHGISESAYSNLMSDFNGSFLAVSRILLNVKAREKKSNNFKGIQFECSQGVRAPHKKSHDTRTIFRGGSAVIMKKRGPRALLVQKTYTHTRVLSFLRQ
ncbi:AGC family protein kinase [Tritrichomonas foetus]|uniref:AGC family protein kinase n=1 Tax=Tritrichomonas foetus TaxID=1144522 RepID=A0A1J4K0A7_9EUKA|nr:AGC family protein kinase [Tritrichomonas foetus]|eukprot:OHT02949.1 AGC family protein kinase [Tritrichomonas foetus]